jgi:8-oxo-dGTP diphosphatase
MKTFGIKEPGFEYVYRPGVYGLFEKEDKAGVIQSPLGYFLIGGGLEEGETDETCLIREGIEEAGCLLVIGDYLETVDEYVVVPGSETGFHKRMAAYRVEIAQYGHLSIETDHELIWMDKREAAQKMYLKGQSYLIEQYL